jgi:hypothetical protein
MIFDDFIKTQTISIEITDSIYGSLKEASTKLANILKKEKDKIIPYILFAFDNDLFEDDLMVNEVQELVAKSWSTVHLKSPKPIGLFRAMILQALSEQLDEEIEKATIIWLIGKNFINQKSYNQKEAMLLTEFVHHCGEIAEENAVSEWSVQREFEGFKIQNLKVSVKKDKIDFQALVPHLQAATSNQGVEGNPYTVHNQQPNWGNHFATRTVKGFEEVFVNFNLGQDFAELSKNINDFMKQLNKKFTEAVNDSIQSSIAVEQRSQLLWWKETLYSRKLKKSYRDMTIFERTISMPYDLNELLPDICPISVDFILKETFLLANGKDEEISLKEFIEQLTNKVNKLFSESYIIKTEITENKLDFASFLGAFLHNRLDDEDKKKQLTGINFTKKMNYSDIALWILNSLLANRIAK